MNLTHQISQRLRQLSSLTPSSISTIDLTVHDGVQVMIHLTACDSMSCSFGELRLTVPSLLDCGIELLKTWAEDLSERVTYLLENLGPLELSAEDGAVLMRSLSPQQDEDGRRYYEILLQSQSHGNFTLRRYCAKTGDPDREPVDIHVTHELLIKLVNDVIETFPSAG